MHNGGIVKSLALEWVKIHAELLGSRGWARLNGRPEPEDADYDYCFFTDDTDQLVEISNHMLEILDNNKGWSRYEPLGGYLVICSSDIDIGVYPVAKRAELILAYKMRDAGISKEQMVLLLDLLLGTRDKG